MLNLKEIFSVSIILFSVIDIVGSIPIIIDLRNKSGKIESFKATLVAGVIMVVFLYLGKSILNLFGLDVESFALAGALIIFLLGMEMVLGKDLFKTEANPKTTSIVPLAFPLIAGAGTMTTILTLRSEYHHFNVLIGILINLLLVFLVLKTSTWIEKKLGRAGTDILRKVFGIILLAIAIKIFKSNLQF
ncbi:MarC family protein [Flexithrix dorotheae]|uniref:MarC family protein n=1 Tax=Flexithrix dorotheae TaxID=70993 RepID=UPI000379C2B4|nr:MarC family protein [Flexithrix dorotheae]